jgi:hypothetical protein
MDAMRGQLVSQYGTLWARNSKNLTALRRLGKLSGVYVLCDGSMPVYIGKGRLARRIRGHVRSKRRGQHWDHFSWFEIKDPHFTDDIEALLLRLLPHYLRSLNRLKNNLHKAKKNLQDDAHADPIKRPSFATKRSVAKKQKR